MTDTPTPRERAEAAMELHDGTYGGCFTHPDFFRLRDNIKRAITAAVEAAREDERRKAILEVGTALEEKEQAAYERGWEEGHKQGAHDEVLLRKIFNEECDSAREQAAFRRGAEAMKENCIELLREHTRQLGALPLSPPQPAGGGE